MAMYARTDPETCAVVDRWDGGVSWMAHPEETGRRTSHAVRGDDGVWLFDPLDAPGVDDVVDDLGDVAGVAVLSNYHARDADALADRYDVPVFVPSWVDRVDERVTGPVERFDGALEASGFRVRESNPIPGLRSGIAYREADGTLYVPDVLGTAPLFTVGDERVGVYLLARLSPPRAAFADLDPERLLVGHGPGVFSDAAGALDDALAGARRRFPRALAVNGWTQVRALLAALG